MTGKRPRRRAQKNWRDLFLRERCQTIVLNAAVKHVLTLLADPVTDDQIEEMRRVLIVAVKAKDMPF